MNKTISNILIFVAGIAVGSVTACALTKERYRKYYADIADAEIESVKTAYKSLRAEKEEVSAKPEENEKASREYASVLHESGYNYVKEGEAVSIEDDKPYIISPDEFGECTYETITLTYYADRVLADEVDDIVDDVEGTIGRDSLLHFGEYEDDCIHVRNDIIETDYEVLLDTRSYWGDIKPLDERG